MIDWMAAEVEGVRSKDVPVAVLNACFFFSLL